MTGVNYLIKNKTKIIITSTTVNKTSMLYTDNHTLN